MHDERERLAALHQEVLQGAAVGVAAGALFGQSLAAAPFAIGFGAVLGCATGGVCGLLLWVSAAELPEAPIPPVRGPTARPVSPAPRARDDAGARAPHDRRAAPR